MRKKERIISVLETSSPKVQRVTIESEERYKGIKIQQCKCGDIETLHLPEIEWTERGLV